MIIDVSCAIIERSGKVLVAQRNKPKNLAFKWEFPGGKIRSDESPEDSIVREIKEELNITIGIRKSLSPTIHHYGSKKIRLIPYICYIIKGNIIVTDHNQVKWLEPEKLHDLEWCDADLPIVSDYIKNRLNG